MENATTDLGNSSKLLRAMAECPVLAPEQFSSFLKVIYLIINSMSSVLAVVGNSLVVAVLLYYTSLRRRSNYLLLGLAVTDLMVGLLVQTLASVQIWFDTVARSCAASHALNYFAALTCGASAWLLCLISYDRYVHLDKLTNYNQFMSWKKLKLLLVLCWLYPGLLGFGSLTTMTLNAYYIMVILGAFITMFIIFTSYFLSWRIVKNKSMKSECRLTKKVSRHWQVAKSVAIIIACYICAWMPLTLWVLFYVTFRMLKFNAGLLDRHGVEIFYITLLIGFTNSSINPVLYYWRNKELRDGMSRIVKGVLLGKKVSNKEKDADTSSTEIRTNSSPEECN